MHLLVTFTFRDHTPGFRNVLTPDAESSLRTSDRRVLRVDTELLDKRAPLRGSTFTRTSIVTSVWADRSLLNPFLPHKNGKKKATHECEHIIANAHVFVEKRMTSAGYRNSLRVAPFITDASAFPEPASRKRPPENITILLSCVASCAKAHHTMT